MEECNHFNFGPDEKILWLTNLTLIFIFISLIFLCVENSQYLINVETQAIMVDGPI